MKKKIPYLDILEHRANVVLSGKIEEKASQAIRRAAEHPPRRFLHLFYRPAFVYALAALCLIIPASVIVFTFRGTVEKEAAYTARETLRDRENHLLGPGKEETAGETGDLYPEEVSRVNARITSGGVIITWENPGDPGLEEIIIEKRNEKNAVLTTLFPGTARVYVDPDYVPGDYYRIRCMNKKNILSQGVYVTPGEGD
jgi:hypothetical protein